MTSRDLRAGIFTALSPRTDPDLVASYREYWRNHNPLWARPTSWPAGKIYTLDDLMPRRDFSATAVFNEWWRPSGRGLAAAGANLLIEDQFSVLTYVANAPGKDVPENDVLGRLLCFAMRMCLLRIEKNPNPTAH